jgi:hypothetical protein
MCGKLLYYIDSEEEDQELNEGETYEEEENNEKDEEEVDKKMNFEDKEGLSKAIKLPFPNNHKWYNT